MGLVRALLVTLEGSMLRPSRFFRTMRRDNGFFNPLVYAIIFGSLSIVISVVWELALATARNPFLGAGSPEELLRMGPLLYGLTIILSPIAATVLVLVTSVILHMVLLVLGGANHGFRTSFRVVCYCQGTGILNLVPYLGAFAGSIWNLVLLAVGLRESHRAPTWKAVLAVLGLLAAWLGVVVILGALVVAAGLL
ncbi:MAG: YIP1 family protein [Candidatus Eisenbacteria bacterium]|nr:YIP1 family protein [Candidatus Eisenbacteria bacterium]